MKHLKLLFFAFLLCSCQQEQKSEEVHIRKPVEAKLDMSHPGFFMGSDFGRFFQTCFRHASYEWMVLYTHSSSKEKYGEDFLFNYYQTIDFNFEIERLSAKPENDSTYIMNYNVYKNATRKMLRMKVGIERDTCKLILTDGLMEFWKK